MLAMPDAEKSRPLILATSLMPSRLRCDSRAGGGSAARTSTWPRLPPSAWCVTWNGAGFVVMKKPPEIGGAALGRGFEG
jgi:hypothetical protein